MCLICEVAEAPISIRSGAPAEGLEGVVPGELEGGLSAASASQGGPDSYLANLYMMLT